MNYPERAEVVLRSREDNEPVILWRTSCAFNIKYQKKDRKEGRTRLEIHWGVGREERQFPSEWDLIVRVRASAGSGQWEASTSRPGPIRGLGLAALKLWLCDQVHPSHRHNTTRWEYLEMFRNTGNWYSVCYSWHHGSLARVLLHMGSDLKLINSKCYTKILCKSRLLLFIMPITLTCIGTKKSVTGAKTWAINMLMNSFSCLFLFIRGGCG